MNLIKHNQESLATIHNLINVLSDEQYSDPLEVLSGSSIGAHVRHTYLARVFRSWRDGSAACPKN